MVRVDSPGCRVDGRTTCDRVIDELTVASRLTVVCPLQLPEVERLPRAKNEILKKGSQTRSGGLRATRVDVQAA